MFAKPHWFRKKRVGWGLVPVTWQGWVYALVWLLVLCLPFVWLVGRQLAPEALIWLVAAGGLLLWEVRQIRRAMRPPVDSAETAGDVVYIGDDEAPPDHLATRKFDLHLRP